MTREIKFRAWDKSQEEMIWNVQNIYNGHPNPVTDELLYKSKCYVATDSFAAILDNPETFEIMQFTGIKDKNDKEIYEEDIVKWNDEIGVIRFGMHPYFQAFNWHRIYPSDVRDNVSFFVIGDNDKKGLEVIGNIYEDKELLNQ